MSQFTMGQRIATRRKLLNLSQEALADKLEVSRQAVSKWESDTAIPEVDKLIALGNIFSVSVGWILGTEADPLPHPDEGFTDGQLEALEKIVSHSRVKKRKLIWMGITLTVVSLTVISALLWNVFDRIDDLFTANEQTQQQLTQLSQNDTEIQSQIDSVNGLLKTQAESEKLLEYISLEAFTSEDQRTVTLTLYVKPKLYQESNTAYISVKNPYTGHSEMLECNWNGAYYWARHTVDIADGYQYSFLLVNEYGYKEESLNSPDGGFGNLGVHCTFHQDSENGCVLPEGGNGRIAGGVYYYDAPIHTPHLFAKSAVAYKDIALKLTLNGEVIWQQSYKEEFRALMTGSSLNSAANALQPKVAITLPQLAEGDYLKLTIAAETVNGGAAIQSYETVLDAIACN